MIYVFVKKPKRIIINCSPYQVLLLLLDVFLGFRNLSIARSVSRNWVPVADIRMRFADAFMTRNKWVNEVMAITQDGSLNCKFRSMQFLIYSIRKHNIGKVCINKIINFVQYNFHLIRLERKDSDVYKIVWQFTFPEFPRSCILSTIFPKLQNRKQNTSVTKIRANFASRFCELEYV